MIGFILFFVAILLAVVIIPIGFVYAILFAMVRFNGVLFFKMMDRMLYLIAYSIDQLGNVVCSSLFNDLLITKEGCKFGHPDETISSVLGRNKKKRTLSKLGKKIACILNKIDPGHVEKAIENCKKCN
jgi:hypothetical protein